MKVVFVSGGFDPLHVGHVRYIQQAARIAPVIVLLNSDEWLVRKKGYAFMTFDERREIMMAINNVYAVYAVDDSDGTVCAGLKTYRNVFTGPGVVFAKGGDRTADNTPEQELCKQLGIDVQFNIGGGKIASSSELVDAIRKPVDTPLVHEDAR